MNLYSVVLLAAEGTLADVNRQISPNTRRLLNRLERRGIPVILCSARTPEEADAAARQCGLHGPIACYDGSLILDGNRSILADTGIDGGTALKFKRFVSDTYADVAVTSYLYNVWLADSAQNQNVRMAMDRHGQEVVEGRLEDAVRSSGHVHKMACLGPPLRIQALREQTARLFPSLTAAVSHAACLEIASAEVSRYTAMERIRQYYHVTLQQIAAVGSGFSDIDMIRRAGLGIAMGNAPEAVRQAAARVTASNNEEGVYIALKNLRFRPPQGGCSEKQT